MYAIYANYYGYIVVIIRRRSRSVIIITIIYNSPIQIADNFRDNINGRAIRLDLWRVLKIALNNHLRSI